MVATAIFEFSFVMPIHQSHFFSLSALDSSFQKVISSFFCSVCLFQILNNYNVFLTGKNHIDFLLTASFPLCRPVARASNVLHDVMCWPKLCFTKGQPVFCQYPGHCFVSASDNVLSLGFVQIKTTVGAAGRICHLEHSSRS